VNSLYTNIPNDEGIQACETLLNQKRPKEELPSNSSLIELLKLVLLKNNFECDNKQYLQIGGTAMGTRVAPYFANLFMNHFEEKYVYTYEHQPLIWLRFIDDIFCIWTHWVDTLMEFINHLNTCHHSIKCTHEFGQQNISFLDTGISFHNGKLESNLYVKPTDSHNYLFFSLCHPRHTKEAILYSQFIRVRRICSNKRDFIANSEMLKHHFLCRGYPCKKLEEAYDEPYLKTGKNFWTIINRR